MLFKRIIYLSKLPLKLNKFKNASSAAVPEEAIQQSKHVIKLDKENSFPTHFAPSRGIGRPIYSLIPGPKGELLADYVLFEETMKTGLRRNYELRLRITNYGVFSVTNYDYENFFKITNYDSENIGKNYELRK